MSRYFVPITQPQIRNSLLDFTPVNQGLQAIGQAKQNETRNALMRDEMDMRKSQFDAQQARFAKQDARADQDRQRTLLGNIARAVDAETDPTRRAAMWKQFVTAHGTNGLTPEEMDPMSGPRLAMAQAGIHVDPLDRELKVAQIANAKAQAANAQSRPRVMSAADRAALAQQYGLQPGTSDYQHFVLTGDMPKRSQANLMNPTVQKELFEAEDMVSANRSVISSLNQAKALSSQAYGGPAASARGYTGSLIGLEGGQKTQELENLITTQALESLRAVFGGNPTEGERKILLDVAGSVGKTDAVRQAIYDRAIEAANRRLASNEAKARALRTGEYFQPGYSPPRGQSIPQGAIDMLRSNPALAADFDAKYGPGASRAYLGGQ